MAQTMEDTLLRLLADTHSAAEGPRKQAELHLKSAQTEPAFPTSLAAIASHASVGLEIRQSALLVLRKFVEKNWGGEFDEDGEMREVEIPDQTKEQLRSVMLELATSGETDRKIRSAARFEAPISECMKEMEKKLTSWAQ